MSRQQEREPGTLADLRRVVAQFLLANVPAGESVVGLAVSGGADSMALLECAAAERERFPFRLVALHVNHGLRGVEAELDANHVRWRCEALGVQCVVANMPKPPAKTRFGTSEEGLRKTRLAAFADTLRRMKGRVVVLAHNRDDQAETVLRRMLRGAGPDALAGMRAAAPPREEDGLLLLRPMLGVRRESIRSILREASVAWRDDASNESPTYERNRLRLLVAPLIEKEIDPQSLPHLADLAADLARDRAYWDERVAERIPAEPHWPDALRRDALLADPPALAGRVAARWLRELASIASASDPASGPSNGQASDMAPTRRHVEDLLAFAATSEEGTWIETMGGYRVRREIGALGEMLFDDQGGSDRAAPPLDAFPDLLRALPRGIDAPPLAMALGVCLEGDDAKNGVPLTPGATATLVAQRTLRGGVVRRCEVSCALIDAAGAPMDAREEAAGGGDWFVWRVPASLLAERGGPGLVLRTRRPGDRVAEALGGGALKHHFSHFIDGGRQPAGWRDYMPLVAEAGGEGLIVEGEMLRRFRSNEREEKRCAHGEASLRVSLVWR